RMPYYDPTHPHTHFAVPARLARCVRKRAPEEYHGNPDGESHSQLLILVRAGQPRHDDQYAGVQRPAARALQGRSEPVFRLEPSGKPWRRDSRPQHLGVPTRLRRRELSGGRRLVWGPPSIVRSMTSPRCSHGTATGYSSPRIVLQEFQGRVTSGYRGETTSMMTSVGKRRRSSGPE